MPQESDPRKLFDKCVAACADSMFRVAFRLTSNNATAEDLVQQAYTEAWKSIDSLRDTKRMRSWLFAILRNQYLKSCRQNYPVAIDGLESVVDSGSGIDERQHQIDMIQNAIQQLDEDHKLPILLVSMEGLSVEEASAILSVPKGTVLSRMHRGRIRLKEVIERQQSTL